MPWRHGSFQDYLKHSSVTKPMYPLAICITTKDRLLKNDVSLRATLPKHPADSKTKWVRVLITGTLGMLLSNVLAYHSTILATLLFSQFINPTALYFSTVAW